jgi:hypothetical protein
MGAMRTIGRSFVSLFLASVMLVALAFPARADMNYSGTYRIVTATGKHMIVTLIENDNFGVDGMYAGNHGVAGRLQGKINKAETQLDYTWEERGGDSENPKTVKGWGTMTWSDDGKQMRAKWGYDGERNSVGQWNATLIDT